MQPLSRRQFLQSGLAAGTGFLAGCGVLPPRPQDPAKVPRLGYLASATAAPSPFRVAFVQGLAELGWIDGRSIAIDFRASENMPERSQQFATDFVRAQVDVIFATGTSEAVAAKQATSTIPIVTAVAGDPVGSGLAASLAHPGGNVTGLTQLTPQLSGKRLELLKEAVPRLSRVAVLANPTNPANRREWDQTQVAAQALGLELRLLEVRAPEHFEPAFEAALQQRADGLIVFADPLLNFRPAIADFATTNRLPGMYGWREHVDRGGLMSYGPNPQDLFRRAATYVDKILKGANPAELPIEQPTKFDFVINKQTADALGLAVPQSVLQQATDVIQ